MKAKDWIELNNEKRELLTKENAEVYGEMLVYLRMSHVSQDELEPLLVEILDHLLDAQESGKTAEDVFGSDPKAYCDELLQMLSKPKWKEWLSTFVPAVCIIALGMYIFTSAKEGSLQYSSISLIGGPISIMMWIGLTVYAVRASSFQNQKKSSAIMYTAFIVSFLVTCSVVLLEYLYGKPILIIEGTALYILLAITAILLLFTGYRTFGISGVIFFILFISSKLIIQVETLDKQTRLTVSIILIVCAFITINFGVMWKWKKKTTNVS